MSRRNRDAGVVEQAEARRGGAGLRTSTPCRVSRALATSSGTGLPAAAAACTSGTRARMVTSISRRKTYESTVAADLLGGLGQLEAERVAELGLAGAQHHDGRQRVQRQADEDENGEAP